MKLLPLVCLCLVTRSGKTFADENGVILKDRSKENIPGLASKPSVTSLKSEDGRVLQCVVRGAYPKPKVEWQDSSGNILQAKEPNVTDRGGSYDVTLQTTVNQTDNYRCVVTQVTKNHSTEAEIYVTPNGAAPEPSVTILDQSSDWSLLKCVVRGASPKPKVEWQDSSGNILPAKEPQVIERGGSYDIILQTTVTQTDHYRCVVTQEEIKIKAEIYVYFNEETSGKWIIGVVIAIIGVVIGVVGVVYGVLKTRPGGSNTATRRNNGSQQEHTVTAETEMVPINSQT